MQVVEAGERPGGGMRTEELMRPGFRHDVCSTVQPMAAAAPFFREFDLESRGVRLVQPEINFAHPLDGGGRRCRAGRWRRRPRGSGPTRAAYRRLFEPLVEHGTDVVDFFLTSRLRRPPTRSIPQMVHFGLNGLPNVRWLAHRYFDTEEARALLGGAAAHGMLDLSQPLTSALGMLLVMLSHHVGWPLIEGGSQKLADAMVTALEEQGGEVVTGHEVTDLREFDGRAGGAAEHDPEAFVGMAGDRVHEGYRRWVLALPPRRRRLQDRLDPVRAGAVDESRRPARGDDPRRRRRSTRRSPGSERPNQGRFTDLPYVLAVQPTVPDPTRAPGRRARLLGLRARSARCPTST